MCERGEEKEKRRDDGNEERSYAREKIEQRNRRGSRRGRGVWRRRKRRERREWRGNERSEK